MSLIALIDKYGTDLAVPWEAGTQEVVNRYSAFGQELIKLPSFTHNREDMRAAVSHMMELDMMELDFNRHARYHVAAYAMRRSALEDVTDISAREETWRILELAQLRFDKDAKQNLREVIKDYVSRVGKSKAKEDLLKVKKGFERVSAEVDANYLVANKADIISMETAENYGQHIAVEKMALDAVLGLVKPL